MSCLGNQINMVPPAAFLRGTFLLMLAGTNKNGDTFLHVLINPEK